MDTATRNRQIKKILSKAFGASKITVRGSRGTAYGYVSVKIDFTPLDQPQSRELEGLCKMLLAKAGVDLGRAYTDDDCRSECDMCRISFNAPRYYRTMKHDDGSMSVIRLYSDEWETA